MFNRAVIAAILFLIAADLFAQSPSPSPAKAPPASPTPAPTTEQMINSLGENDLQAAISLLKSNFTNPEAITDSELNRATLQGLLLRMPGGLQLLPGKEAAPAEPGGSFYAEIFENHIGYARLGTLDSANLKELDKKLQEFAGKKVDAVIVDLRASGSGDFAAAAEFAKRFCPKGKPLFSVRKPGSRQDRAFSSDRDPAFQGLIVVLSDGETAGGGEALAGVLKLYNKALIIGQSSAGRAAEYSDLPLPSGKILRVASAAVLLPDGQPLFPAGVKPDLPVETSFAEKNQIFKLANEKGMAQFVYETERPHLNEAALIAGTNPELDIPDAQRRLRNREKQPPHDPVLQRALDVVTSLEIYQKR
ncbi:MAG TPA: S41 family peptidase [Chthoniobacterales bacterium]|jgi:hypothetical protein|nr:S41 family peptidase [Chthoniobacterales bacterium]